jgi:hypothetical protein
MHKVKERQSRLQLIDRRRLRISGVGGTEDKESDLRERLFLGSQKWDSCHSDDYFYPHDALIRVRVPFPKECDSVQSQIRDDSMRTRFPRYPDAADLGPLLWKLAALQNKFDAKAKDFELFAKPIDVYKDGMKALIAKWNTYNSLRMAVRFSRPVVYARRASAPAASIPVFVSPKGCVRSSVRSACSRATTVQLGHSSPGGVTIPNYTHCCEMLLFLALKESAIFGICEDGRWQRIAEEVDGGGTSVGPSGNRPNALSYPFTSSQFDKRGSSSGSA